MIEIRADLTQLGLAIEARQPKGEWITVQLTRYKDRTRAGAPYPSFIDPAQDAEDYFAAIDRKGIPYRRVNNK